MTSGKSAPASRADSARTLYGLSPYADSVRTQTAHFVSYTSAYVPERCLMSAYSLRTRGFIRGSIPLSSTIKRLVRRGSGKAYGQKPKMYGHADRIDGQGKGSGKLPVLLDCCVLTAYSCPMTTSDGDTQRDELASIITDHVHEGLLGYDACTPHAEIAEAADGILAAGYRKPRTITTVEELDGLPEGSVARSRFGELLELRAGLWYFGDDAGDGPSLPATVLHEPEAEVRA